MVGALGFEPRSAGVSHFSVHPASARSRVATGRCSSWSSDPSDTHSSSFPCNWSPRYYQVILYPRRSNLPWGPALMMLSVGISRKSPQTPTCNIRTTRLVNIQRPNTEEASPQALGLIPLLICPKRNEVFPNEEAMARTTETTSPAEIMNIDRTRIEEIGPNNPDLAIEPIPCGTKYGILSHESHASQSPRYASLVKSL